MRSSIAAMQQTARRIHEARSLSPVEQEIVPVKEIFRLQGADELKAAERRYLPSRGVEAHATGKSDSTDPGPDRS